MVALVLLLVRLNQEVSAPPAYSTVAVLLDRGVPWAMPGALEAEFGLGPDPEDSHGDGSQADRFCRTSKRLADRGPIDAVIASGDART